MKTDKQIAELLDEQNDYAGDLKLGEDMMHLLLHLFVLQVDWEQEHTFVGWEQETKFVKE
jgi:hypothetical protein